MNAMERNFRAALPDACSIEGCNKPASVKGWCKGHYLRWYRHGDPMGGRAAGNGEAARYLNEVVLPYDGNECLIWPYGTTNGYGIMHYEGRHTFVSTIVCEKTHGPAPVGDFQAAHSCGRGAFACVTKRHLSWKTRTDNEADKIVHGTLIYGERSNFAKLTEAQVSEIQALKGAMRQWEIADRYGIHQAQVSRIHSGKRRRRG